MRYSIIHHDVREEFGLNLNQYAVADSIHQLSNGRFINKPNTKIASFLGLDEGTVRNTKKVLLEKGLIEENESGVKTTEKWHSAVTYKSRKNSEDSENFREIRKTSESLLIYKEVKNNEANASTSSEPIEVVPDQPYKERPKKDKEAIRLRDTLYGMFEKEYGVRPSPTISDLVRVAQALKRMPEKDVITMVEDALWAGKKRTVREVLTDRAIDIYLQDNV